MNEEDSPTMARAPHLPDDATITSLLVRAISERSLIWFVLLSATALTTYAVVATPLWWKLVGVAGYAVLIVMPVLHRAWRP